MKRYLSSLLWVVLAMPVLLSSCSKDEEEVVISNQCYISSFSLGSLKRYMHIKDADGNAVLYPISFAGSTFPMTIDQQRLTIENRDSLPLGTSLAAALATVEFQGALLWRKADYQALPDTAWHPYAATDSIDFTTPLHFLVVATDGSASRQYTVSVNVHHQKGDSTVWQRMADATPWWIDPAADPTQYKCGNRIYTLADTIVGKKQNSDEDSILVVLKSRAEGSTEWRTELLDDSLYNLPTENLNFVRYDVTYASSADKQGTGRLLLVGGKAGEVAVIWSKNETANRWMFHTPNEADKKRLTVMRNLTVLPYDGGLIALGGQLEKILYSRDHGITWDVHENNDMNIDPALQEAAKGSTILSAAVDKENFLWVLAGGQLWRGRINRLGWLRQDRK